MMNKIWSLATIAALYGVTFFATSCDDNDKELRSSFTGCFTILGDKNSYKLVDDANNVFYPTIESVNQVTDNAGFGKNKRAQLFGSYVEERDMEKQTDGTVVVKNVELRGGTYIITHKTFSSQEAEKAGILNIDSIFPISKLSQCWLANGYLNTIITAQYSANGIKAISPTINLRVIENRTTDNEVTFELLYNRHTTKKQEAAGTAEMLTSHDISDVQVPGTNDSVMVQVEVQGGNTWRKKVARKVFEVLK